MRSSEGFSYHKDSRVNSNLVEWHWHNQGMIMSR